MNIESYYEFCMSLAHAEETFPFDKTTLVFKVKNKMFALCDVDTFESINLKCAPEMAIELREKYSSVLPGFHMSKTHWNTVLMDASIADEVIKEWIMNSYKLVVASLPKKDRFVI